MKKGTRSLWTLLIIVVLFLVIALSGVTPSSIKAQAPADAEDDDPDLPPFARGRIDKEEYLRLRDEHVSKLRGLPYEKRDARVRAIREMERQEFANASAINTTAWTSIGPAPIPNGQTALPQTPVSGRVSAIAVHPTNPSIVYVGAADGGVYRSTDGGATWLAIFDSAQSLAIGAIAIVPSDPTTVLVGTGESSFSCRSFFGVGVYRILNADTTPVLEGPFNLDGGGLDVMTGRSISRIVVHPTNPNTIFIATTTGIGGIGCDLPNAGPSRGLFRSSNALAVTPTFTKLNVATANGGNRAITDVVMDPGDPNVLVCAALGLNGAGDGGIYRSTNALAANPTFTQALTIGAASDGIRTELAINKVGIVVTVLAAIGEPSSCPGQSGTLKKSTDGGQTWSSALAAADGFCSRQCFYNISLALDPFNANNLILGGQTDSGCSRIAARSTDGGASFTSTSSGVHADNHVAVFAPSNSSIAYMGTDGGIYKSTDGGASWTSLNNAGFNATQFMSLALHPTDREFMIGGTQDNGTEFKRTDGTWIRADFSDGGCALIDRNATDTTNVTMYHIYFNQTGTQIGFGRVDTSACAKETSPTQTGWAFRGVFSGAPDPTPRCDGTPGQVFNGIGLTDNVQFYAPMALGPGSPNTVYFGTDRLYRSINKGDSMTVVSQAPIEAGQTVTAIGISPQNDNVRIVGLSNGHVYATGHGASVLTNVGTGFIPEKYVGRVVIDPNNITTAYVTLAGFGLNAGQHVWKTTQLGNVVPPGPSPATASPMFRLMLSS